MKTQAKIEDEIDKMFKSGGCEICTFSYGKWHLCSVCIHKLELLQTELKGITEGKKLMIDKVLKLVDECSTPVMDEEAMEKFIEDNQESSIYRLVNFDKLKQKLNKLKEIER